MIEGRVTWRMDDALLREAEAMPIPAPRAPRPPAPALQEKINQFFLAEKVAAVFDRGSDQSVVMAGGMENMTPMTQRPDGGTVFVAGPGPHDNANAGKGLPAVTLAVEHYNRMVRILEKGVPVKVELNVAARFFDETDGNGINIIGEIPGQRPGRRGGPPRGALRHRAGRHRRDRQRRRLRGDDGGGANPEGDRRHAPPDDPRGALGRGGIRAWRVPGPTCAATSPTSPP